MNSKSELNRYRTAGERRKEDNTKRQKGGEASGRKTKSSYLTETAQERAERRETCQTKERARVVFRERRSQKKES